MAVTRFGAIHIGSYEVKLKIYEISAKNRIVCVDYIRHVMELGRDVYKNGKISFLLMDELCEVLGQFVQKLKEYEVKDYEVTTTSAIREAVNQKIILDRIKVTTGLKVRLLNNAQQRFLGYKAFAFRGEEFTEWIEDGTAIVDVGAGSIQISLFDNKSLVTTQNIKLGSLRIRELLYNLSNDRKHFDRLIEELIDSDIQTFKRMFVKEHPIKNIIALGDYIVYFAKKGQNNKLKEKMTRKQFLERFEVLNEKSPQQIADKINISEEQASLLIPCVLVYEKVLDGTDVQNIWISDADLCDGLVAEYAMNAKKIQVPHDFDADIIESSRNIAKRYGSNTVDQEVLEKTALTIFDVVKKYAGMGKRERLLLQISAILHDCGNYINISYSAESAYHIIQSTEIIGLSKKEQEIVANVVKTNMEWSMEEEEIRTLDENSYSLVAKLTAILQVANAINRSHKQKFKNFTVEVKKRELLITTRTQDDITLERGLFAPKAEFFEEVYGIKPILKQRKGE